MEQMHFSWRFKAIWEKWQEHTTLLVCCIVWCITELVLFTTSDNTGNFHPVSQLSLDSRASAVSFSSSVSWPSASAASSGVISSTLAWRTISWLTTISVASNSVKAFHIHMLSWCQVSLNIKFHNISIHSSNSHTLQIPMPASVSFGTTTMTTILQCFSRTIRLSWCQKKAPSGLYGTREDNKRQTHWQAEWAPLHPD